MANGAVSKERKKELEQLDPFQENVLKAVNLVKQYQKQLLIAGCAVLVIVFISYGIMYSFKRSEAQAAGLSVKAMNAYTAAGDPVKGYENVKEDFLKLFTEYGNTQAGRLARAQYAKICFDAQKFDESFEYYSDAYDLFKHQAQMENVLLAALGHVSLAQKKFDQAESYFGKIEAGKSDLLKDEAMYTLAMIYEAEGKPEESRKMYEKVVEASKISMYGRVAESKLSRLK